MQTKKRLASLFFLLVICAVLPVVGSNASPDTSDFSQLSDEELKEKQQQAGLEGISLDDLLESDELAQVQRGALAPAGKETHKNLVTYLEEFRKKHPRKFKLYSRKELEEIALGYAGYEMHQVERPDRATTMLRKNAQAFVDTYLIGAKREKALLVSYILYRQITWVMQSSIYEKNNRLFRDQPLSERLLSCMPFGGRTFKLIDFVIRFGFSGLQLYTDVMQKYNELQLILKRPELLSKAAEKNPFFFDEMMRSWVESAKRAYLFFSVPTYYGSGLGLAQGMIASLALPYVWFAYGSSSATGNPCDNAAFCSLLKVQMRAIAFDWSTRLRHHVTQAISYDRQEELFDQSFGIFQPRFLSDTVLDAGDALADSFLSKEKRKPSLVNDFTHRVGKRAIYSVVMHVIISLLAKACRAGSLQKVYRSSKFLSQIFVAGGLCKKNPAVAIKDMVKQGFVSNGFLEEGKDLCDVLDNAMLRSYVFPGAFSRAVRSVCRKQDLPLLKNSSPKFVDHLNTLDGMTTFKMLTLFSSNPMTLMTFQMASDAVYRGVIAAGKRDAVMEAFCNEVIAEVFLNREHIMCQVITETALMPFVGGTISSLQDYLLPST